MDGELGLGPWALGLWASGLRGFEAARQSSGRLRASESSEGALGLTLMGCGALGLLGFRAVGFQIR
eukprot:1502640-Alexandrium_andersonii.AAC.1